MQTSMKSIRYVSLVLFLLGVPNHLRGPEVAAAGRWGQTQATGSVYCGDASSIPATIDQLSKGLPVQEEAIRRTEAQIEAAKTTFENASREQQSALLDLAKTEISLATKDFRNTVDRTNQQIKKVAMRQSLSSAERKELIEATKKMKAYSDDVRTAMDIANKTADYLYEHPELLQRSAANILEKIKAADEIFVSSGAADVLGGLGWEHFSPYGGFYFSVAKGAIDASAATWAMNISERELAQANQNLEVMRGQKSLIQERLENLKGRYDQCARLTAQTQDSTKLVKPGQKNSGNPHSGLSTAAGIGLGLGLSAIIAEKFGVFDKSTTTDTPSSQCQSERICQVNPGIPGFTSGSCSCQDDNGLCGNLRTLVNGEPCVNAAGATGVCGAGLICVDQTCRPSGYSPPGLPSVVCR